MHELLEDRGRRMYFVAYAPRTVRGSAMLGFFRGLEAAQDGDEIRDGMDKLAEDKQLTHLTPPFTYAGRRFGAAVFELATEEAAEAAVYRVRVCVKAAPPVEVESTSPMVDGRGVAMALFEGLDGILLDASEVPYDETSHRKRFRMVTDTPARKKEFLAKARALFRNMRYHYRVGDVFKIVTSEFFGS